VHDRAPLLFRRLQTEHSHGSSEAAARGAGAATALAGALAATVAAASTGEGVAATGAGSGGVDGRCALKRSKRRLLASTGCGGCGRCPSGRTATRLPLLPLLLLLLLLLPRPGVLAGVATMFRKKGGRAGVDEGAGDACAGSCRSTDRV
jgi:hypothetical protein